MYSVMEKKFYDQAQASIAIPTTWALDSFLGQIINGTGPSNRTGNKIMLKSFEVFIQILPQVAAGMSNGTACRFIMWHNKETNGALLTAGTLFPVTNSITAVRNSASLPKVSVLRDEYHTMVVTGTDSTGAVKTVGPIKVIHWKVFPNKVIDYTGTGGGVADLLKHDYGIGYIATSATCCNIQYTLKMVFTDA